MAIDDDIVDGGDALVFGAFNERVNAVRGPVTFFGGLSDTDTSFTVPIMLPGETNLPVAAGTIDAITDKNVDGWTITDFKNIHANGDYGPRAGFDPRINLTSALYDVATINGDTLSGRIDITSVSEDILSFDAGGRSIALTVDGIDAVKTGAATVFGTLAQDNIAPIKWREATLALTGELRVGSSYTVTIATTDPVKAKTVTFEPSAIQLYKGVILTELAALINADKAVNVASDFVATVTVNLLGQVSLPPHHSTKKRQKKPPSFTVVWPQATLTQTPNGALLRSSLQKKISLAIGNSLLAMRMARLARKPPHLMARLRASPMAL
jgi:hypothetical protein